MIKIVALDLLIENELVGTYHFTNKELAESFAKGLWENISQEKQSLAEFKAIE